jgi:hypothetical protein
VQALSCAMIVDVVYCQYSLSSSSQLLLSLKFHFVSYLWVIVSHSVNFLSATFVTFVDIPCFQGLQSRAIILFVFSEQKDFVCYDFVYWDY